MYQIYISYFLENSCHLTFFCKGIFAFKRCFIFTLTIMQNETEKIHTKTKQTKKQNKTKQKAKEKQ